MLHKTKGIVLHRFKYSDSSIIVNIYTQIFGKQSYLIYNSKTKKQKNTTNLLQPFFVLDMQVYNKENVDLQKVKEISTTTPLTTIPFDIKKNSIALFLSEFINKVLENNEPDKTLFEFIENSIAILDLSSTKINNFHVVFLLKLCKFLGIQAENNFSETNKILDMKAGKFIIGRPQHSDFLDEKYSNIFYEISNSSLNLLEKLNLNSFDRNFILNKIIDYYKLHLNKPNNIKSLKIFKEIFS